MAELSIDAMRNYLRKCYGGTWKWLNKVNKMSDRQVMAIYYRMMREFHR